MKALLSVGFRPFATKTPEGLKSLLRQRFRLVPVVLIYTPCFLQLRCSGSIILWLLLK